LSPRTILQVVKETAINRPYCNSKSCVVQLATSSVDELRSMEKCPYLESNLFASRQLIPPILWNPVFYYRIHKCPPLLHFLSQFDPVRNISFQFLKNDIIIIIPYTPTSSQWCLNPSIPTKTHYTTCHSPYVLHAPKFSISTLVLT